MGVGDDKESYGFDGYRLSIWNGGPSVINKAWDVGDVVGCGIDLENRVIEYFINGKSIGIASQNILAGPNEAYFPALTSHGKEKCVVNTGSMRFAFEYFSEKTKE